MTDVIYSGSLFFLDSKLKAYRLEEDLELHSFFADEMKLEEVASLFFTQSLFNDKKLIIINNADGLKKGDLYPLLNRAGRLASVVLTFLDEKKAQTALKNLEGFKLISEQKQDQMQEIMGLFESRGLRITRPVVTQIWQTVQDMALVDSYAEKFMLYFSGRVNKPEELLELINGEPQEKVFKFLDCFMAKNRHDCLGAYTTLGDIDAASAQIVNMLTNYMAGLYFTLNVPEMLQEKSLYFKGNPYFMRSVNANRRNWNTLDAVRVINKIAELDIWVKTGRVKYPDALLILVDTL